jgi:FkbM family methyltransferase
MLSREQSRCFNKKVVAMKSIIVTNSLGRLALTVRESFQLVWAACWQTEVVGVLANDRDALYLASHLCASGKTFVDIGAHMGSVVSRVMRHDATAKIIAVEAIPEKVTRLRRNFPSIEIHSCALGETDGETTFFVNTKESGLSSLGKPAAGNVPHVREIRVALRRLDGLISSDGIDVIKIDVEGAELGVLIGGEKTIEKNRPTIMFESGPADPDDGLPYTKEALWKWFSDRDYALLVPNRLAHDDPGLTEEGFLESHLYPWRTTNYFAVARERRIEVRDKARKLLKI